jgi:hypothetical protein
MTKDDLSECKECSLSRIEYRAVCRLLDNRHALEVLPERMWRIGEASVREGVGHQHIAELIVNARSWDGFDAQHGQAGTESQKENGENGETAAGGETGDAALNGREPAVTQARACEGEQNGDYAQANLDQQQQVKSFLVDFERCSAHSSSSIEPHPFVVNLLTQS